MAPLKSPRNYKAVDSWRAKPIAEAKRLLVATDHGQAITVPSESFAGQNQRSGGWGSYPDAFFRFNAAAFKALDILPEVTSDNKGIVVRLKPGGNSGAIPLKSALTGQISGGLIVKPRFDWPGVGQILHETGWHAAPEFLALPLVPGSEREVPPWVLAGPVLKRLEALLHSLTPGFRQAEEFLIKPRGQIVWAKYLSDSLVKGKWHHLPCRFPDLATDPLLRRHIRWTLERIHRDILGTGGNDPIALNLGALAIQLLYLLDDVTPIMPRREELDRYKIKSPIIGEIIRQGIEAIAWIVDERGLGGGNERDGLAWVLPLEKLWEGYVESIYKKEVSETGGEVKVGRLGETIFPLNWSNSTHRTLGHLVPDIVIRRANSIQIVDAKYKAHLAEIDEMGWYQMEQEIKDTHRADLHQILAYAALYDAEEIIATLVYPLRQSTYLSLLERKKDRSYANLYHGGRHIKLELRGLPFGSIRN